MCGIAGIISRGPALGLPEREALDRMLVALRHRGPDDEGVWGDPSGRVLFGHTRLAIQDLTEAGHEPIVLDGGQTVLTYNGEIFNHLDLRPRLEATGRRFRGHCDAETLAAALAMSGTDALAELRGFFAFAALLGDAVVLVRDRLGKKPLYYAVDDQRVVFASEVRALLASEMVPRHLSDQALDVYLAVGAVPAPETILESVRSVPPGSCVTVDANGVGAPVPWWHPPAYDASGPDDPQRIDSELEAHLRASIRDRLLADVPVGAFLSGGLDSPTIVALMQQESGERVSTFTVGFEGVVGVPDERVEAARIAGALGSNHHDVVVTANDVPALFDGFLDALDVPAGDAFNSFLVSRAAAGRTTVVLSGVGADELLYGYSFWRQATRLGLARLGGRAYASHGRAALAAAVHGTQRSGRAGRVRKAFAVAVAPEVARLLLTSPERRQFTGQQLHAAERWLRDSAIGSDPGRQSDLRTYLQPVLLADLDAMTMHRSLEARAPFLDHRLVEWALRLAPRTCWDEHGGKAPLRRLARRLLPPDVSRAPKRGFVLPFGAWLAGPLRSRADELAAGAEARGIVDGPLLRQWLEEARTGRRQARSVWHLLVLEGWLQRHAPEISGEARYARA